MISPSNSSADLLHTSTSNSKKQTTSATDIDDWTQDLLKYFDFKYSKYITVILVSLFIFYHGYLNSFYGKF